MAVKIQGTNSAAVPAVSSDGNDGLVVGTDTIDLSIGGASKFKVGAAGQLGIGGATYGTDGHVLTSTGASTAPAWEALPPGGITTAVLFRKTATTQGNSLPITDWEKADDTDSGIVGTFADPSSGIFTFPSTGIWHIAATMSAYVGSTQANNTDLYIYLTTDNSTYDNMSMNAQGGNVDQRLAAYAEYIFDVTSTANCKCKISWGCHNGNEYIQGSSTRNYTTVRFTRLGDT